MFIGSIRAQDGRWQIDLQISLLCCYSCYRLVVVVVVFLCCCCSFVVVFVVRVDVSATVIVVLVVLSFGRRRRCCSCACRCPLSVRIVVVVLVVATLLKTKSSVRVYWFLSSWRLQVFLSAFKVFDSDGNPCLVVSLTTGFSCSLVMLRSGTVYTRTPDHGQTKHEWQRARSYRCRLVRPNTCRANVLANPPGLALDPASNWRFAGLRAPCCL